MTQTLEQLSAAATELLPCPFCGQHVTLVKRDALYVFACPENSPCIGVGFATYAKADQLETAITAWNTRTGQLVAVSDDAVERVAQAIMDCRSPMQAGTQWLIETEENRNWYRDLAKAAIAAMKGPKL